MGNPEWVGGVESRAVSSASFPPICRGVDNGVSGRLLVVGVGEVLDPGDHGRVAQTVALIASLGWVVLDIKRTGKGLPVFGPSTAVGEEVLGLSGTRAGVGVGKVVTTTDEASRGGTSVMFGECGINVGVSFSSLNGY
jgi:hypothetical protein